MFLQFYVFMIVFFGACAAHDFATGRITGFSFGFLAGAMYYCGRYVEVKRFGEEGKEDE